MALFESYDRREPQILAVLKNYGINSIEEFTDTKFDLVQNDNDGLLDFTCKEPLDSGAVLLLKSLFKGIQGIQESYGKQYVTFH